MAGRSGLIPSSGILSLPFLDRYLSRPEYVAQDGGGRCHWSIWLDRAMREKKKKTRVVIL